MTVSASGLRRAGLAVLAVMLAACGSPPAQAGTSPRASRTASPASLNCKLPVFFPPTGADLEVGWVSLPRGETSSDPASGFTRSGNLLRSRAKPTLAGPGPAFYDRAHTRWLPVSRHAVSDDGAHYAYVVPAGAQSASHPTLRLVDVDSASERNVSLPQLRPMESWAILEYTGGRIYLSKSGFEGPGAPGLWSLEPASGKVEQVFDQTPVALQGKAAWFERTNPTDPKPVVDQRTGEKLPDELAKRDIGGGPAVPWFARPGSSVQLIGLDADGHPLAATSRGQSVDDLMELSFVSAPNVARSVYRGTVADIDALSANFSEKQGTWFGSANGIYLYGADSSFRLVSNKAARPAGRCA